MRMVLDSKRSAIDPFLSVIALPFQRISANVLSGIAMLCAILAGICFYQSSPSADLVIPWLLLASLFILLNGLFDALDGKIAKMTNTASKAGDFLDHALDRYADVFIVGGLALSGWCDLRIGFFALIGVLLTSYMGTQAQAVGCPRLYAGLLGRADRLVLLAVAPVVQHVLFQMQIITLYGLTLLDWVLVYIAIMGNITALQRFYYTMRFFKHEKSK